MPTFHPVCSNLSPIRHRLLSITEPPGVIAFGSIMSLHPVFGSIGSAKVAGQGMVIKIGNRIWNLGKVETQHQCIFKPELKFVKSLSERQDLNIAGFVQTYSLSGLNKNLKHNHSSDQQTSLFLRALISSCSLSDSLDQSKSTATFRFLNSIPRNDHNLNKATKTACEEHCEHSFSDKWRQRSGDAVRWRQKEQIITVSSCRLW